MRSLLMVGVLAVLSACTKPNAAICCVSAADCESIGISDPERGCALGLVCSDHRCSVPPDGPRAECTVDNECTSPTPRCAPDLQCVECVEATDCPPSEPTCDVTSHECRTCVVDTDCASEICDVTAGTCVAEPAIAYAAPNGTSTATCTRTDRCSVQRAFLVADSLRHYVKLAPGVYTANLVVSNKSVNVRAAGATVSSTSGDTLTVNDGGSLRLSGAIIASASANGNAVVCKSLNNVDRPPAVPGRRSSRIRGLRRVSLSMLSQHCPNRNSHNG